jgi:hypothetical protein
MSQLCFLWTDPNFPQTFLRGYLLEQGVIHQSDYGQPVILPSMPATRQLDASAPRFDYSRPLRSDPYNAEVALHLSRAVIRQLPAIGAQHAGFWVTAVMHNEEVMMNLIYVRADYTQKKFCNANPAMEAERIRDDTKHRHYGRKGTVRPVL